MDGRASSASSLDMPSLLLSWLLARRTSTLRSWCLAPIDLLKGKGGDQDSQGIKLRRGRRPGESGCCLKRGVEDKTVVYPQTVNKCG